MSSRSNDAGERTIERPGLDDDLRRRYEGATATLDPPFAVVDLAAFDANLDDLVRRAAGVPIRVASKSVRCRFLIERALAHPGTRGVLCYSLPEALWLHRNGISDDLVIGYPTVDRAALRKLASDPPARAATTLMVDSIDHLDVIDAALGPGHSDIRVCIELDVSWRPLRKLHVGTRRSPVFTVDDVASLARAIVSRDGFQLVGLMGYEGQIAGIGDISHANPLMAPALRLMQHLSAAELTARRTAAVRAARECVAPGQLEFVNGGGTGSIEHTIADESVTEVAAGSGLIGPTLFDGYSRFRPQPAALFALPVVRKPSADIATLFAGGYVASGKADRSRLPTPFLPRGLHLLGVEGAGEVQTPVAGAAAAGLRVGDRVWLRHAKAGELAERFDEYHIVVGDRVERTVPTYRGDAVNFG